MTLPVKKRSAAKRTDISVLETAPETGLSAEEAAARAEAGWSNLPVEPPTRTVGQIIRSNVFAYFNVDGILPVISNGYGRVQRTINALFVDLFLSIPELICNSRGFMLYIIHKRHLSFRH